MVRILIYGTRDEHEAFGTEPPPDVTRLRIPSVPMTVGSGSALITRKGRRIYAEYTYTGEAPSLNEMPQIIETIRIRLGKE